MELRVLGKTVQMRIESYEQASQLFKLYVQAHDLNSLVVGELYNGIGRYLAHVEYDGTVSLYTSEFGKLVHTVLYKPQL